MKREHMIPLLMLLAGAGIWYYSKRQSVPALPRGTPSITSSMSEPYPMGEVRGVRNNNPGNIKISSNAWLGKVPKAQNTDGVFEQFTSAEYGIRALYIDLRSKIGRGVNTIEKILTVYAPASENDTFQYITSVSSFTGIPANKVLSATDIKQILPAIIKVENGFNPYTAAQYSKAYSLV